MAHIIYKSPVKSQIEQRNILLATLLIFVGLLFYISYLLPGIVSTIDASMQIMQITL